MALMAAALALPPLAKGDATDPLRCEAIGMRKEGQRYDCLGRCERHNGRRSDRLGAKAEGSLADCRQACEDRYAGAMDEVDQRDVCSGTPATPDPNRCRARLLRAGASRLICKSECTAQAGARPALDGSDCAQACDEHYSMTVDRIMAKQFCAGQAVPTD
jgi:hypothetical protein